MRTKKLLPVLAIFICLCSYAFSFPLESPTWGFSLDLPEDYDYTGGDGKDRFSFENQSGAKLDIVVYHAAPGRPAPYAGVEELARDVHSRLKNSGDLDSFEYRGKKAILLELSFPLSGTGPMSGWAICLELGSNSPANAGPLFLAMAYGPAGRSDLEFFHLSALDSIAPVQADRFFPGPITEFAYPRERRIRTGIFGIDAEAWIFEEDAEAAQALIDREYQLLRRFENSEDWREAWIRFYRAIYRDSFERLADIAFQVERRFNVPPLENRDFADHVLSWVQSFEYERELMGSDFINLISGATEGRGDCDNRSMLWAIILNQANIPAAIMVSRNYGHAMGLAELPGAGARFELDGQRLLVAETTANIPIGLIGEGVSDTEHWLGVSF